MGFASPIFKKFSSKQQHYLQMFRSQCYINRPINVEIASRYLYRPLTVTELILTELMLDRQDIGNKFYAENYETRTNNLGI